MLLIILYWGGVLFYLLLGFFSEFYIHLRKAVIGIVWDPILDHTSFKY